MPSGAWWDGLGWRAFPVPGHEATFVVGEPSLALASGSEEEVPDPGCRTGVLSLAGSHPLMARGHHGAVPCEARRGF